MAPLPTKTSPAQATIIFAALAVAAGLLGCSWVLSFDGLEGGDDSTADGGRDKDASEAGALPVDCTDPNLVLDPVCIPVQHTQPGVLGSGPILPAGVGSPTKLGFGFATDDRILLAADGDGNEGAVLGLDLRTGARSILSGAISDAAAIVHERGTGPSLGGITGVVPLPDGAWIASTFTAPRQLIRIDPDSGDRSLLFSWSSLTCSRPDGETPITLVPQEGYGYLLASDDDGSLIFPADISNGDGYALVRWKDEVCSVVSYYDRATSDAVGEGPFVLGGLRAIERGGDRLYALGSATNGLIEVELISGARRIVSLWDDPRVGSGKWKVGRDAIAPDDDVIWTLGPVNQLFFVLTEIDPATGDRFGHDGSQGAVYDVNTGNPRMWRHPSERWLVLELNGAFILYDPLTDNSNLLSY
jgi:hypothetical protein